ncbi:AI-2E family transporter [Halovivax sp.]|uniref:AI-2E family transporter n=1 Tax=Halovivax sp. TaxID=1935978 RepID=UPI0025C28C5B|nr:AI-2E family transporter [Halovivax sp.]
MNRATGTLLALVAVFGLLSLLLVLPFLQFVLFGILIAYVLHPLQGPLERRTSPTIAAGSLVALAVALFVLPVVVMAGVIADDAARILGEIDPETLQIAEIEEFIEEEVGVDVDLAESAADAGQQIGTILLERTTEFFAVFTHVLVGFGLALFLIYYLLKDGDDMVGWLRERTPLPDDVQDDLFGEMDDVMRAVLIGHVLIAFIEGLIAGLGLFATGIPNAAFWTVVMMILALVPLVGAFLVWGPAVAYLFLTGEPILAVGLFVYSAIVVGVSDDYLRPIVVDRYAEISPAIIIIGVLGGIYAFGIMGLFFGPVVVGALLATVNVLDENWERLEEAGADG